MKTCDESHFNEKHILYKNDIFKVNKQGEYAGNNAWQNRVPL
jgi:hypothetical protein